MIKKILVCQFGDFEEYTTAEEVEDEILDIFINEPAPVTFIGVRENGKKVYMYPDFTVKICVDQDAEELTLEDEIELGIEHIT